MMKEKGSLKDDMNEIKLGAMTNTLFKRCVRRTRRIRRLVEPILRPGFLRPDKKGLGHTFSCGCCKMLESGRDGPKNGIYAEFTIR